mgnify:CR=1 FL=1
MRNISEIIKKARELKQKGFTTGEIADELNVSRETALWPIPKKKRIACPEIFLSTGRESARIR